MALLKATKNFIENTKKFPLPYTLFPEKKNEYNSNSFITGLLKSVSEEKNVSITYKDTILNRPGEDTSPHEATYSTPVEEIKPNRPQVYGEMIMR